MLSTRLQKGLHPSTKQVHVPEREWGPVHFVFPYVRFLPVRLDIEDRCPQIGSVVSAKRDAVRPPKDDVGVRHLFGKSSSPEGSLCEGGERRDCRTHVVRRQSSARRKPASKSVPGDVLAPTSWFMTNRDDLLRPAICGIPVSERPSEGTDFPVHPLKACLFVRFFVPYAFQAVCIVSSSGPFEQDVRSPCLRIPTSRRRLPRT